MTDSALETGTRYRCPGEAAAISESVHLARLAVGWEGCADCVWRHEHGTAPRRDAGGLEPPDRIRRSQVSRTEFGVRGAYLNAVDRFRGAQLASIFTTHLTGVHREVARQRQTQTQRNIADGLSLIDIASAITVAVGYDGRHGAPDVFSGVVSAVLQNGCNVIDAGRCTASSLLHISRRYPHLSGSLLVTGAGGASGDIGLDVFDTHGQSVAVPWQKFGVSVRLPDASLPQGSRGSTLPDSIDAAASPAVQSRLRDLRSQGLSDTALDSPTAESPPPVVLQLPELHGSVESVFRSNRRSGNLSSVPSETSYRDWLLRWWPVQSGQQVRFAVSDSQTAERLKWLTSRCELNIEICRATDHRTASLTQHSVTDSRLTVRIEEDDRFITVCSRRGRQLAVDELATWMNRFMPASAAHLTAHASPCGRRILLVDIAAPSTGSQQQVISDGLAVAGWILTSIDNGNHPLPA